ncbi:MAG: hypothetical protein LC746_09830, partial [Acidobacteria bacterium]|nr:hypothetical protein [Acidobacteriota bacterium]
MKLFRVRPRALRGLCVSSSSLALALAVVASCASVARAEQWGGIVPLKSRRADVEKVLGKPVEDKPGATGTLRFKVQGGTITVAFVEARYVAAHHLAPDLEGTVRQIVLQHDSATDTPDSMQITTNRAFQRDREGNAEIYRNQRDGIAYTFIEGKLRTTYYTASAEEFR